MTIPTWLYDPIEIRYSASLYYFSIIHEKSNDEYPFNNKELLLQKKEEPSDLTDGSSFFITI